MAVELPHLPDLPNAGYATPREKELSDGIMFFMRETERDRLRLLSIVLEGKTKWRTVGASALGWLRVDTELLDAIYDYFTLQAAQPSAQRVLLSAAKNPHAWRACVKAIWPDLERQREVLRRMASQT